MDQWSINQLKDARFLETSADSLADGQFRIQTQAGEIFYAYRFPQASVAASVILRDVSRDAFLLIKRRFDPFGGYLAFPGGFLEAGEESTEQSAVRELKEEASVEVSAQALQLIDVRSSPERDPRRHVLDVGYFAELQGPVHAAAGDDAAQVQWCKANELNQMQLAFDHNIFWNNYLHQAQQQATGHSNFQEDK